jgi:hypothetical protein
VTGAPSPLVNCCCQLTNASTKLSAATASSCALVTGEATPVRAAGDATNPQDLGGLRPDAIVIGANGKPYIRSPWNGHYNLVDHTCHNAAAENASKTDGYIACEVGARYNWYDGHTVNWGPDPTKVNDFCAYEPQDSGSTLGDADSKGGHAICCWRGGADGSGTPLWTPEADRCVHDVCGYTYDPGFQVFYPPGSAPLVARDCAATSTSLETCSSCCTSQADYIAGVDYSPEPPTAQQEVADYRQRCSKACTEAGLGRQGASTPATPSASWCLPGAVASQGAMDDRRGACGTSGASHP